MIIETERLILRPWQEADREAYAVLMGDPQVRRFYPSVLTPAEADAQFDRHLEMQAQNRFHFRAATLRENGAFVGLIGIGLVGEVIRNAIPTHPEVEIGWVFNADFWGKGLAPEGARACLDHAWQLGLPEIVAFTAAINQPSQRVMVKIGMIRDPDADYEHPLVPKDHPIRAHVLYRIANPNY